MFYAALHFVDAYLADGGIHPRSHADRNAYVQRLQHLRPLWPHYQLLDHRSRDARYRCVAFSPAEVQHLRETSFAPLKQHLAGLLGI